MSEAPKYQPEFSQAPEIQPVEASLGPETETKIGITEVAEDYALAQLELEKAITKSEPDKWIGLADEVIKNHPALSPYAEVFRSGAVSMAKAHEAVEEFWREQDGRIHKDPELGLDRADPEYAQALFNNFLFAFGKPEKNQDPVGAIKGRYTTTFELSRRDMDVVKPKAAGFATRVYNPSNLDLSSDSDMPVIVIDRETPYIGSTITHEARHTMSRTFQAGHAVGFDRLARMTEPTSLVKRAAENFRADSRAEDRLKSELEAFFTQIITASDYVLSAEDKSALPTEKVEDFLRQLSVGLAGAGYDLSKANPYTEPGDQALAEPSIQAIVGLREHYMKSLPPDDADFVTIKALSIFPINAWPTVRKLVEGKAASRQRAA